MIFNSITMTDVIIRLLAALFMGAAIGFERQWRQRMAGLRTNALVSIGACLFVILAVVTPGDASPTRIAAQVVSGIGFLGAGVIMREGLNIRGLNTAATLWCSAAVGVLIGGGFIAIAVAGTLTILITNIILRSLTKKINLSTLKDEESHLQYRLTLVCSFEDEGHIREEMLKLLSETPIILTSLSSEDLPQINKLEVNADLLLYKKDSFVLEQIVKKLCLEKSVSSISWKMLTDI